MRSRSFLVLALSGCGGGSGPILEAPFTQKYVCSQTKPVENLGPSFGHKLSTDGAKLLLARQEGPDWRVGSSTSALVVSTVSPSGESDPQLATDENAELRIGGFQATPGGWALVYVRSGTLHMARFDGAELSDRELRPVEPDEYYQLVPRRAGGWFLAWRNKQAGASLVVIDPSGAVVGETRTLLDPSGIFPAFSLSSGAVAWSEGGRELGQRELFFATVDDDGAVGPPRLIRAYDFWSLGFGGGRPALMALPAGFILSWTESTFLVDDQPVSFDEIEDLRPGSFSTRTMIWLARLDANGEPVGPSRPLSVGENDVEQVEPELFDFRGDLGLVWSEGSVIYLCGGCVPDHDLRLMVLDPSRLDPLTDVLSLPWDDRGGLLGNSTAAVGSDLGIASDIRYHNTADRALGFARCE